MESAATEPELTEPYLATVLSSSGLGVEYVRAEGNTLFYLDTDGNEIAVTDYCGGYASLILGHNNAEITAHAKSVLDSGVPVYAQFSRHPVANRLAAKLNEILRRETGDTEPYFAHFASTGAEAIETAVKHAEFDRVLKVSALMGEIEEHVEQARDAAREGRLTVADSAYRKAAAGAPPKAATGSPQDALEHLVGAVARHNGEVAARPPVLLALEGSFHGKLMGSVQLTHNDGFRSAFGGLGTQALFLPHDQPDVLKKTVDGIRAQARVLDVVVTNGVAEVVERDFPAFCAFLVEPIQGEGGIRLLDRDAAAHIQRVSAEADCPLLIDEIQTGLGRTGAFFASSLVGLRGDYYALSKSLGGGIAKSSVVLVHQKRYRGEFELVHSSTFAKDGFSTAIALKVLEMLEAEDGAAYRQAVERGEMLRAALDRVRADYSDVVKETRGKGLLQGLEFHDQSGSGSAMISSAAAGGILGYVAAGFLLRAHHIRVLPTASAPNTLRFAPSLYLTEEETGRLETGLRDLCALLRDQDEQRLTG
ncbi:aminotransferase class III-fold pyridoxal phosphate-dependent enzyme [Streptomyces sp. NBC_01381]|uniref:aspartate aminotransferase family protein n=1 Tax=Streptomyces sp. NBC_01381 TaxID=2903845 RepID=UPI00224F3046|nr:aminotransferase class III-fold pyridoxal phosphate-dependent enzyme [Streptomyces sp. NBC_01381]MCX4673497.1 aminotransferase class III-fold pyridoxal phosphate-dependent enzyme [Streptomyces sp. NBC_01381]